MCRCSTALTGNIKDWHEQHFIKFGKRILPNGPQKRNLQGYTHNVVMSSLRNRQNASMTFSQINHLLLQSEVKIRWSIKCYV